VKLYTEKGREWSREKDFKKNNPLNNRGLSFIRVGPLGTTPIKSAPPNTYTITSRYININRI
tara:strand:+ start:790 stop:975 length:186 start_codon:yes stop_codon:yes gene_type:complete